MKDLIVYAGDNSNVLLMAGLLIASALVLILFLLLYLVKINKKRK